jgi:proteasome lid subunit RPN8/RPN11
VSSAMDASELLSHRKIRAALKTAAEDTNIGGAFPKEQGGFIVRDSDGTLSVARWSHGTSNEIQPPICKDGKYEGKRIVGSFHTHPNVGPGGEKHRVKRM